MAYSCIHQLVYPRRGERVLMASLVKVCEIHTYLPLFTFLLCYHCIGQSLRVEHFLNSPSLFKLVHLLLDSIRMIFRRASRWLFPRKDSWVDIQIMANEVWIHPRSFIGTSCEHINIFFEKQHQIFLLLRR